MPPKKQAQGPSKKETEKKKAKLIEDKTFGLKNKKGAKMQKFIAQVEASVSLRENIEQQWFTHLNILSNYEYLFAGQKFRPSASKTSWY